MDDFFKVAGDFENIENKDIDTNMTNYFKPAEDLEEAKSYDILNKDNVSVEDIKKYLSSIVSGKEYDFECELGTLCEGGSVILSFDEVIKMIEDGSYNIIKCECINKDMIVIEYQRYNKDFTRGSK